VWKGEMRPATARAAYERPAPPPLLPTLRHGPEAVPPPLPREAPEDTCHLHRHPKQSLSKVRPLCHRS